MPDLPLPEVGQLIAAVTALVMAPGRTLDKSSRLFSELEEALAALEAALAEGEQSDEQEGA